LLTDLDPTANPEPDSDKGSRLRMLIRDADQGFRLRIRIEDSRSGMKDEG